MNDLATADRHVTEPDGEAVLQIRGLVVSFDGFRAVDGVDLDVRDGELRFLIGPNGAGKTTLVDAITGLVRVAEGTVRFGGHDLAGMPEHRRVRLGIGRSFQTPTVFDTLTVEENLDLAESFRRAFLTLFRRRRGRTPGVDEAMELVGLTELAGVPAGILSHGQKQWLEIAMLLVQDPRLMLLDEPVAGMSPAERVATGELLRRLAGERTIVVIEHDMAFLRRVADSVTVLHEGRVLSEGSVEHVQHDPAVREVYLGRSVKDPDAPEYQRETTPSEPTTPGDTTSAHTTPGGPTPDDTTKEPGS